MIIITNMVMIIMSIMGIMGIMGIMLSFMGIMGGLALVAPGELTEMSLWKEKSARDA